MEADKQSKWLAERLKQMGTARSRPSDLTSENAISIGPNKNLYIHYQQWGSDQKFMNLSNYKAASKWRYPKLPKIFVPQDAHKFVAAMDAVIRQLPVEEPPHKEGDESPLILVTEIVAGADHRHDFKLSAWHQKDGKWNFEILSVPTSEEHLIYFPFSALPELRQQMVKILAEHDGSEKIDKMPAIPEWATQDAPDIEQQQEKQDTVKQEHVTDKKADDDEDCPCST